MGSANFHVIKWIPFPQKHLLRLIKKKLETPPSVDIHCILFLVSKPQVHMRDSANMVSSLWQLFISFSSFIYAKLCTTLRLRGNNDLYYLTSGQDFLYYLFFNVIFFLIWNEVSKVNIKYNWNPGLLYNPIMIVKIIYVLSRSFRGLNYFHVNKTKVCWFGKSWYWYHEYGERNNPMLTMSWKAFSLAQLYKYFKYSIDDTYCYHPNLYLQVYIFKTCF